MSSHSDDEPNDFAPGSGSGKAPTEPQPPMDELLERAREDARRKRAEAGLPPLSPDELEQPRPKGRKPGKRSKADDARQKTR